MTVRMHHTQPQHTTPPTTAAQQYGAYPPPASTSAAARGYNPHPADPYSSSMVASHPAGQSTPWDTPHPLPPRAPLPHNLPNSAAAAAAAGYGQFGDPHSSFDASSSHHLTHLQSLSRPGSRSGTPGIPTMYQHKGEASSGPYWGQDQGYPAPNHHHQQQQLAAMQALQQQQQDDFAAAAAAGGGGLGGYVDEAEDDADDESGSESEESEDEESEDQSVSSSRMRKRGRVRGARGAA